MNRKKIEHDLRVEYPHGHSDFIPMTLDEMSLHSSKNFKYAFGGDPLGNFNRVSALMKMYPKVDWAQPLCVALIYFLKQLDSVLWMLNSGHDPSAVEGMDACLGDISVYSKIMRLIKKEADRASSKG